MKVSMAWALALLPAALATRYTQTFDAITAPKLDVLHLGSGAVRMPDNSKFLDTRYAFPVSLKGLLLPSLVSPNSASNVLVSRTLPLGQTAAEFRRTKALSSKYKATFRSVYYSCIIVSHVAPLHVPCKVTFTTNNGQRKTFTSNGGTKMSQAILPFGPADSMTVSIQSVSSIGSIITKNAALMLDTLAYDITPNP